MNLPKEAFDAAAACPLDGVRVIDMSRLVAGNAVSSQLADFGAEVIKIEDPGKGDPLRAWQTNGVSVHWKLYARNKKSVALSLRPARGRELLLDLISTAEVLIENFRPGTLEKMGLAPAELLKRNPRLVIVRVSGWGQDGPYKDRPGFGTLVESMSGYASRTGFADREPVLPPTALADMVAGLYGAFSVMVALRRVEVEGGGGQVIDLPLIDPLFSFIATEAPIYKLTKQVRPRTGSRSETTSPRNVFRTKDGRYIGISASIQAMSERLFRAIGREDMISDPRFANNTVRVKNADETEAPIIEFIGARTLEENMAIFEAAEVTASPVYDIDQFLADPHVRARGIVVDVPDAQIGELTMHNIIPRLSDTPGRLRSPAPAIGEHTAEILGQLGVGRDELAALAKEGIVGLHGDKQ
jgi:crotonobetainyl-CoA:carnitine CoA-transferase CaiB-like acyl-CoA transferase